MTAGRASPDTRAGHTARGRYARILHTPHVLALLGAAVIARLPIGIDSLAIVLFLRERTGSYANAGLVAAVFVLGSAAGAPLAGRLIDRLGARSVLLPLAAVHASALVALVALVLADVPVVVLAPAAAVAGAAVPPIGAALRPLWPHLLEETPELVPTAYALDSVLIELVFVIGPLLTAAATALQSPGAALGVSAALVIAGTLMFTASPPVRAWEPDAEAQRHGWLGPLRAPGLQTLVAATIPMGFCFGAVEVTLPAFSEDMATRAWAGVLVAIWSLGSAAGGLLYGARTSGATLERTYVRLAAALPLTFLPLAAAPTVWVMPVLCLVAGVVIAPLIASGNQLVGSVAPRGAMAEAFTWLTTALVIGVSAGNAAAGALVEAADWRVAFLVGAACAALGSLLAFARRATLGLATT